MKKANSCPSFYIDTTIPSKKGYKFFIFNLLHSLSIFCIGIGILIGIVFAVLYFFKSKIHPQFDINIILYICAIAIGLGLIIGIIGIILKRKFKKYVKNLYEDYLDSFDEFKPVSFQKENQSFYYIENNTLHLHQNLEEVYKADLSSIKEMTLNTKLSKQKPFSKIMFKKKFKRRFTCIGITITPFEGEQFIIAINLLLANYSLQTSKKKFKDKYNFTLNSLNKLIEEFNKSKKDDNAQLEQPKDKTTNVKEVKTEDKKVVAKPEEKTKTNNLESSPSKDENKASNSEVNKEDKEEVKPVTEDTSTKKSQKETEDIKTNDNVSKDLNVKETTIAKKEDKKVEDPKKEDVSKQSEDKAETPKKVYNFQKKANTSTTSSKEVSPTKSAIKKEDTSKPMEEKTETPKKVYNFQKKAGSSTNTTKKDAQQIH